MTNETKYPNIYQSDDKSILIAILRELEELNDKLAGGKPEEVLPTQPVKYSPAKPIKKA
jgi:hypothetical protein